MATELLTCKLRNDPRVEHIADRDESRARFEFSVCPTDALGKPDEERYRRNVIRDVQITGPAEARWRRERDGNWDLLAGMFWYAQQSLETGERKETLDLDKELNANAPIDPTRVVYPPSGSFEIRAEVRPPPMGFRPPPEDRQ